MKRKSASILVYIPLDDGIYMKFLNYRKKCQKHTLEIKQNILSFRKYMSCIQRTHSFIALTFHNLQMNLDVAGSQIDNEFG